MIALFHAGHAGTGVDDNAGALMAKNGWKQPFGVGTGKRELIGMTDTGCLHLDQHLPGLWAIEAHLGDLERLGLLHCDSSTGFHGGFPLRRKRVYYSNDRPLGRNRCGVSLRVAH